MPVFEYHALDAKGKNIKGIVDADSEALARTKLRSQGRYPVSIAVSRSKRGKAGGHGIGLFERVKSEEISIMTRQLATLLGAGIPLVQCLDSLVAQTRNSILKKVIAQIKGSINEGNTLTTAFSEHPKLFSSIFINMVRAGEASGALDIVLERLADFAEKQEVLKGRLRAALVYPIFMAVIGSAILFILITYIVPNITQVFNEMDQVLPLPTLFLIGMSDFLKMYWWAFFIFLALVFFALRALIVRPSGRAFWDLFKLKVFIIGPVMQKVILARFSSTLGSLLESGVGLMTSMQIVRTLVNNVHVARVIDKAMEQIQKGQSMTDALSDSEWFPPMFVQMIAVGEQSGNLEVMLDKVAKAYEREVETAIMGMTSLIEPLMIAIMGMAVGFIVLSILLPIFEMNQMIH
ncbi:type II secretion system protein GspF [Desulfopila sp. IMCC35006]|uniref:type II secretion system inner membrane protein GspF n=1 Tax=Desulfopila sp. IMCC35006 TaxID=2569542 RepID=UPI0010AB5140|nr:type II secretion system inner membrane protein GspF [Desulfopila sp. IMCC35006]TKB28303.1 type II secretion system protein GspF [Desulfopila sp. IMCC35006]